MSFTLQTTLQKTITAYNAYSGLRQQLFLLSDTARQSSKKAIFHLMKDKIEDGKQLLIDAKECLVKASALVEQESYLQESGSYKGAVEEYLEAKLVESYLTGKTTFDLFEFSLPAEMVLGAISDFTGELVRKSILLATEGKSTDIATIKQVVEDVVLALADIEMGSGGYLRNKIDQVDKNLRKIEDILYTMKMRAFSTPPQSQTTH
ncbi:MAG: hypothetical protein WCP97_03410 [bacterium]